jgi:activator of Hsp90 ATPase-like protein
MLHMERVLHAPRELVFRARSEPEELAKWWGPAGFTAPSIELDLRVGGSYRVAMQPPEGELFYLQGEFRAGSDRINVADGRRDVVRCGRGRDRVRADRRDRLIRCERVRRR